MLQFYTSDATVDLCLLAQTPNVFGLGPKLLGIRKPSPHWGTLNVKECDSIWTGPKLFGGQHECDHYKFTSDMPLFGDALNWSTWIGRDFTNSVERRIDCFSVNGGTIPIIHPDIGGFDTYSLIEDMYQYRIGADLRWIVPDVVAEIRSAIMLFDSYYYNRSVTMLLSREYYLCRNAGIYYLDNSFRKQFSGSALYNRFYTMKLAVLLDSYCPITDSMNAMAATEKERYEKELEKQREERKFFFFNLKSQIRSVSEETQRFAKERQRLSAQYSKEKKRRDDIKSKLLPRKAQWKSYVSSARPFRDDLGDVKLSIQREKQNRDSILAVVSSILCHHQCSDLDGYKKLLKEKKTSLKRIQRSKRSATLAKSLKDEIEQMTKDLKSLHELYGKVKTYRLRLKELRAKRDLLYQRLTELKQWSNVWYDSPDGSIRYASLNNNIKELYASLEIVNKRLESIRQQQASIKRDIAFARLKRQNLKAKYVDEQNSTFFVKGYWDTSPTGVSIKVTAVPQMSEVLSELDELDKTLGSYRTFLPTYYDERRRILSKLVQPLIEYANRYKIYLDCNPVSAVDRGRAVMDAMKKAKYTDINSVALLKHLDELGGEFNAIREVFKCPGPLQFANMVLNFYYGSQLTVSSTLRLIKDCKSLVRRIKKVYDLGCYITTGNARGKVSYPFGAIGGKLDRRIHASIYYSKREGLFNRVIEEMDNWDVLPTISNLWYITTWTFLFDWFTNIGDLLGQMDTAARAVTLPLKFYMSTLHDTTTLPDKYSRLVSPSAQTIKFSHYARTQRHALDLYLDPLQFRVPNTTVIPKALALLVQQGHHILSDSNMLPLSVSE